MEKGKQTSKLVQRQQPKSQANKENKKHVYSIKPPNNGGEMFQIIEFYSCQIYHCISVSCSNTGRQQIHFELLKTHPALNTQFQLFALCDDTEKGTPNTGISSTQLWL